jgi:hypothetical protein
VEQDDRVVYFYLHGVPDTGFSVKSCWVRNSVTAPQTLEAEHMREGIPPLLPQQYCGHPEGAPPLKEEDLQVVWFEEGDAAALMLQSDVLAVIPAWSGTDGFHGYARDCTGESPLCWPLPTDRHLFDRIERARAFWQSWEEGGPWAQVQEELMEAYEQQLGTYSNYYAIDGGQWPPKALLRIPIKDAVALVTAGMCIRPQPSVEMYVEDARPYRRIELGMCLDSAFPDEVVRSCMEYLSGQSNYPWNRYTWLGHGHTFPCDVIPPGPNGEQFPFVLLQRESPASPAIALPEYRGDPVHLLWMVPITDRERDFAESHGSDRLWQLLAQRGVGRVHHSRSEVVPDGQ